MGQVHASLDRMIWLWLRGNSPFPEQEQELVLSKLLQER